MDILSIGPKSIIEQDNKTIKIHTKIPKFKITLPN